MKRNVLIYSLVSLCLMICASCEKVVTDVDIPDTPSKLVVFAFISPEDTLISIKVGQSAPVYGERITTRDISNATVVMSSGGTSVTAIQNMGFNGYTIPASALPIVAGGTYKLDVSTPDGRRVTATCTVPTAPVVIDAAEYLKRPSPDNPGSNEYRLLCKWADQPGVKNYYRLDVNMVGAFVSDNDTIFRYSEMQKGVTDDAGADGQQQSLLFDQVDFYDNSDNYALEYTLLVTDKGYYDYHESRFRYTGDDPFSEPVIVKSNIEGGLGCFGAYIRTVKRVKM